MPRTCTICAHPERLAIDRALMARDPLRAIAGRFGVSKSAAERHASDHLPGQLIKAKEAAMVASADGLLAQVQDLQRRSLAILSAAEDSRDFGTALKAIRETRQTLELLARLTGELRDSSTVDLVVTAEWLTLRAVVLAALHPYPEATASLVAALERHDAGH